MASRTFAKRRRRMPSRLRDSCSTPAPEPDALADTYGGDTLQTTMNLLVSSAHPAGAGLQSAIAEVLLDYGAAVNGVADDESPLMTALAVRLHRSGRDAGAPRRAGRRRRHRRRTRTLGPGPRHGGRCENTQARGAVRSRCRGCRAARSPRPHRARARVGVQVRQAEVALFLLDIGVNPVAMDRTR